MKILGIDTTGQTASAALVEGDKLIAEFTMNYKLTHSQTILPMIADILERTETDKASIDCIACACGPGSFTGLRIGAATATTWQKALSVSLKLRKCWSRRSFFWGTACRCTEKDWNRTLRFYSLPRTAICKEHLQWQHWAQSWQRKDWQSRAMHLS